MSTDRIATRKCNYVALWDCTIGDEQIRGGITRVAADHPWSRNPAFVEVASREGQDAIERAGGDTGRRIRGHGLFWLTSGPERR